MNIEQMAETLGGAKKTSNGYECRCPAHEDKRASLSISQSDGKILVHCKTGCSQSDVISALKSLDLWPEQKRSDTPKRKNIEWTVMSADGEKTFKHIRVDKPNGDKIVFWRPKLSASGFGTKDLALYGIDKISDTGEVVICEGEKAADGARRLGLNGVGTVTGASAVPCDLALQALQGRKVVLWPDNDRAGYEHMSGIAKRFDALKTSYRFVTWPDAPKKGDAADFKGTHDDFLELPLSTEIAWAEPAPSPEPTQQPSPHADISALFMRKKKKDGSPGDVIKNAYNLTVIISKHESFENKIRLNERTNIILIEPGTPATPDNTSAVEYDDIHITRIKVWIEKIFALSFPTQAIHEVLTTIGKDNAFDPFLDYLKSLQWDNSPRGDNWLINHAGAADSTYTRAVSKRFLISVVARTFEPGCKVDTMLILSGDQGTKKSTLFNVLAGDEFFTDHLSPIDSKDARQELRGPAIVEMAELDAMNKKESTQIKAFITTRIDRLRESYGRTTNSYPRRCVFVGTTNETGYLKDSTGGRRFWPVSVKGKINIGAISKIRDQLWAEAVEWYRCGINWWLSDEEELLAIDAQRAVYENGAFDDQIYNYLLLPKRNVKPDWWYCFHENGTRRYLAIEEVWNVLDIDTKQRGQMNKTVRKSIEGIIGGNQTVRNVVTTDTARRKLELYVIPDEFYVRNTHQTLLPVEDDYDSTGEMPF